MSLSRAMHRPIAIVTAIAGLALLWGAVPAHAAPTPEVPEPDGDGDAGVALIIVGVVAIVVVLVVLVVAARRPRRERVATATRAVAPDAGAAPVDERAARLLADLDDLHDRASVEALAGPGGPARDRWRIERQRATLAADAAGALARTDARWLEVQDAVVATVGAVDTATALRETPGTDPGRVADAVTAVNRRRTELLRTLAPLRG